MRRNHHRIRSYIVTRIDRKTPWRYNCTKCGSVALHWKTSSKRPRGKKYGQHGIEEKKADKRARITCRICGIHTNTVHDKKRGIDVTAAKVKSDVKAV